MIVSSSIEDRGAASSGKLVGFKTVSCNFLFVSLQMIKLTSNLQWLINTWASLGPSLRRLTGGLHTAERHGSSCLQTPQLIILRTHPYTPWCRSKMSRSITEHLWPVSDRTGPHITEQNRPVAKDWDRNDAVTISRNPWMVVLGSVVPTHFEKWLENQRLANECVALGNLHVCLQRARSANIICGLIWASSSSFGPEQVFDVTNPMWLEQRFVVLIHQMAAETTGVNCLAAQTAHRCTVTVHASIPGSRSS